MTLMEPGVNSPNNNCGIPQKEDQHLLSDVAAPSSQPQQQCPVWSRPRQKALVGVVATGRAGLGCFSKNPSQRDPLCSRKSSAQCVGRASGQGSGIPLAGSLDQVGEHKVLVKHGLCSQTSSKPPHVGEERDTFQPPVFWKRPFTTSPP